MLNYVSPSEIRETTKIIRSMWIEERIPDSWRHAIHKKLSVVDHRNYRGISLLRAMYKVLERIVLDRLIKHRKETTLQISEEQIWQRFSKPMQLGFLDFEAAFDYPHRGRLLNAFSVDRVPGKFVHLFDDMNQRTTATVRTLAGSTTPFDLVTEVRQETATGPFLFNFARGHHAKNSRSVSCRDCLSVNRLPLTDLKLTDGVVIFGKQHGTHQVVSFASNLLQPMDYALINASRCGPLQDLEREPG